MMADDELYHTYQGNDEYGPGGLNHRTAIVKKNNQGFYVVLANNGLRIDRIDCYEHSEIWAENVAENYVLGVLNP